LQTANIWIQLQIACQQALVGWEIKFKGRITSSPLSISRPPLADFHSPLTVYRLTYNEISSNKKQNVMDRILEEELFLVLGKVSFSRILSPTLP